MVTPGSGGRRSRHCHAGSRSSHSGRSEQHHRARGWEEDVLSNNRKRKVGVVFSLHAGQMGEDALTGICYEYHMGDISRHSKF